jgi:hypothetical protein
MASIDKIKKKEMLIIKKYFRNFELLLITCHTAKENKPNLK